MIIEQDFIPTSNGNRPQNAMDAEYITVHETANTSVGANAEMHARYVKNPSTGESWHYTADDGEIIYQHLPTSENGWHAGDGGSGTGNRRSIGIELCVNSDGNFNKTKANAAVLIKQLMEQHNIPISRVVTHQHWSGKRCPANLLSTFDQFKKQIQGASPDKVETGGEQVTAPETKPPKGVTGDFVSKRVEAKVDGLRFYNEPQWENPYGTLNKGQGFPEIVAKHSVGSGEQYEVKNSAGARFFITAASKYVSVEGSGSTNTDNSGSNNNSSTFNRTLRNVKGNMMNGNDVKELQRRLVKANFFPDRNASNNGIDGWYGDDTEDAVRRFQSMNGLQTDGIAGPQTFKALERYA